MNSIKDIEQFGIKAKGQKELIRHLNGQKLTAKQAVLAKCYDCLGGYSDGKADCEMPGCSLYPFMPYRMNRERKVRSERQARVTLKLADLRASGTKKRGLEERNGVDSMENMSSGD